MKHKITGITPLLRVHDMETSVSFYCNVLGFNVTESATLAGHLSWVLLQLNDIELMLAPQDEELNKPLQIDLTRSAFHADTWLFFQCNDIDAVYQSIKSKKIELKPPYITSYGWQAIDLTDPDGYRLCFHIPQVL